MYKNKINICLDIIDKYHDLTLIAKRYLIDNYLVKFKNCFRCYFEYFRKKIIHKIFYSNLDRNIYFNCSKLRLEYPNLSINLNDENNEIEIILSYFSIYDCNYGMSSKILYILMNEKFEIIKFNHGELLKD